MHLKTYRARSIQEALAYVRRELGPEASVLHTREVGSGMLGWITGQRMIEVTASNEVRVPSRLPARPSEQPHRSAAAAQAPAFAPSQNASSPGAIPPGRGELDFHREFVRSARRRAVGPSVVERMWAEERFDPLHGWPQAQSQLYQSLIELQWRQDLAREIVERAAAPEDALAANDLGRLRHRAARIVESELRITGPLFAPPGQVQVVALVGPTGVGKTTTLARLAAMFKIRQQQRVGLISADAQRPASTEQLRAYADRLDAPLEIVTTMRQMREAISRLSGFDLVLVDTPGQSPRDEAHLAELRALLIEAGTSQTHLVVSAAASGEHLVQTASHFAPLQPAAVLLTKLDEAAGLGHVAGLCRHIDLPLSYVTHGQSIPGDIRPADRHDLARRMVGLTEET